MRMKPLFAAAFMLILSVSLAPQALVRGTVEKHVCSCCDDGPDCSCCSIAPVYPDEAATPVAAARASGPAAWTPLTGVPIAPGGAFMLPPTAAERVHSPPPLLQTSQLRI